MLDESFEKEQIRIKGDNNRTRWFPTGYFDDPNSSVPIIQSWKFDDEIDDDSENSIELIEITITFSTGNKRWCWICTKAGLIDYIDRNMDGSVFYLENRIVVKDFNYDVVNEALHELDQQNQIIGATRPLE
ncbi:hypothetical protein ACFQZE_12100 [Paenibacillus sp. GCM10027627]|uniref:hypothetical protein n=1 Tax=unclassified Paenibacillus TaxID=185978 RepID=UPI00363423F1